MAVALSNALYSFFAVLKTIVFVLLLGQSRLTVISERPVLLMTVHFVFEVVDSFMDTSEMRCLSCLNY